jgi:hypothetical protein
MYTVRIKKKLFYATKIVFKNFLFFLLKKVVLIVIVNTVYNLDCSKPLNPEVKHGKRISCEIANQKEFSTIECDKGYEFKDSITVKQVQTFSGYLPKLLVCNRKF